MKNDLDHNIRNSLVGLALETKRIAKCISRLEIHLSRIDKAIEDEETK